MWNGLRSLIGIVGVRRDNLVLVIFLKTVKGALKRLYIFIIIITTPSRAIELTVWKYTNRQFTIRNFYLVVEELVTIFDYSKIDIVLGASKLVV